MDMHQVRYFLAVSQTLNFTRAAERCHVTQPSLSRAIIKLEAEFGGDLFRRERATTHLTELGRTVLPLLQRCYDSALTAKAQARSYGKATIAPLRIGLTHCIDFAMLQPRLAALKNTFAGLELRLWRGTGSEVLDQIKAGEVELAVIGGVVAEWDRLDSWRLFDETYRVLVPVGHRLENASTIGLSDLAEERLVCAQGETGDAIEAAFGGHGITPSGRHETNDPADAVALVESGFGIALLPSSTTATSATRLLVIADLDIRRVVRVVAVAGRQRSPAATGCLRLLRSADWSEVSGGA